MSSHGKGKRGRPVRSDRIWIEPEMNEQLDARKLSRAFLALALHQAAAEAEAQSGHAGEFGDGDHDESA
jgi:hypothetical protein